MIALVERTDPRKRDALLCKPRPNVVELITVWPVGRTLGLPLHGSKLRDPFCLRQSDFVRGGRPRLIAAAFNTKIHLESPIFLK